MLQLTLNLIVTRLTLNQGELRLDRDVDQVDQGHGSGLD